LWNIRGHPHGGVNPSAFKFQPLGQYIILQNTKNLAAKMIKVMHLWVYHLIQGKLKIQGNLVKNPDISTTGVGKYADLKVETLWTVRTSKVLWMTMMLSLHTTCKCRGPWGREAMAAYICF